MINALPKALDSANEAAIAAFYAKRDPVTNKFKKAGRTTVVPAMTKPRKSDVLKGSGNHRVTRIRHDLRAYLEATRPE